MREPRRANRGRVDGEHRRTSRVLARAAIRTVYREKLRFNARPGRAVTRKRFQFNFLISSRRGDADERGEGGDHHPRAYAFRDRVRGSLPIYGKPNSNRRNLPAIQTSPSRVAIFPLNAPPSCFVSDERSV